MINNVKDSIIKAKNKLSELLAIGDIPCSYRQSGRAVDGYIIAREDHVGNDIYKSVRPDIRVRSHTGKEYFIMLTSVTSIKGIDEL